MAMAKEFGYKVRGFHHALEAYKVADKIAAEDVGIATFSDWWGYKQEAWDAIPWNAVMSLFQAEDGIRDYKVTGVQTCALPISRMRASQTNKLSCGRNMFGSTYA